MNLFQSVCRLPFLAPTTAKMKIRCSSLLSCNPLQLGTFNGLSLYLAWNWTSYPVVHTWSGPSPHLGTHFDMQSTSHSSSLFPRWPFAPISQSAWKALPKKFKTDFLYLDLSLYIKQTSQAWFYLFASLLMVCLLPLECKPHEGRDFVGHVCLYSPSPSMPALESC